MARVCSHPLILGILNVTPDSFSDGGEFNAPQAAIKKFEQLFEDGADFVDVGAESTRPGAKDISEQEEWVRLRPILDYAKQKNKINQVSLDSRKFEIMRRAAEIGVGAINCVGPLPEISQLGELFQINPNLKFISCHMHGSPSTMQDQPIGPNSALKRVGSFFESCTEELREAGCASRNIFMDPGIGFGKSDSANLALLLETTVLSQQFQLAVGVSRKSFISRLLNVTELASRDAVSKVMELCLFLTGARMIRTHCVKSLRPLLKTLSDLPAGSFNG